MSTPTEDTPPELPPRHAADAGVAPAGQGRSAASPASAAAAAADHSVLTYSLDDSLSTISVCRQLEGYFAPSMNENSDLFASAPPEAPPAAPTGAAADDADAAFWTHYLRNSDELLRTRQVGALEAQLARGIPSSLRGAVYARTMQVRHKFSQRDSFDALVKKANGEAAQAFSDSVGGLDSSLRDVLRAVHYYLTAKSEGAAAGPSAAIARIAKVVRDHSEADNETLFFLLLKFHRLFGSLKRDEFVYKVMRSLELTADTEAAFLHLSKQGINLQPVLKRAVTVFFASPELTVQTLDFVVFEGFDFVIRVLVSVFASLAPQLSGGADEDNELLHSRLLTAPTDFGYVLSFAPDLIKFENEFHLLHANSLNNNNNELINLQEVNDELAAKIEGLRVQIRDLNETHNEIIEQSRAYQSQLEAALRQRDEATRQRDALRDKYAHLSMKENVRNTTQANEDFAKRSADLEAQIAQLKSSMEQKRAKLVKMKS
ncbi:Rab-GAP TBC domain-containing protein [[Candida] zeylanoides]